MQPQYLQFKTGIEKQLVKMLKAPRGLVVAANILIIMLLAGAVAQLTWRILYPATDKIASDMENVQKTDGQARSDSRLRSISDLHLFGKADVAVKVDAPIVAPETRLQLKLKGVFASSIPERSFAIISDSKNKDKSYRLGNKVAGGAVLHAVYPDRVILKRNGRLETLRMSTKYKTGNNLTTTSRRIKETRRGVLQAPPKLKQLKETLLNDPQKVWQQVRISPVLKNGIIKGYTVEHKDKQLMQSLNLQQGDVITAVNGKPLSDPSSLYGLMNQLKNQKMFHLTIERNNRIQTIQIQM